MLQQHKAIGTVEECRLAVKKYDYDMKDLKHKLFLEGVDYNKIEQELTDSILEYANKINVFLHKEYPIHVRDLIAKRYMEHGWKYAYHIRKNRDTIGVSLGKDIVDKLNELNDALNENFPNADEYSDAIQKAIMAVEVSNLWLPVPLCIVEDRYGGAYSDAYYLAFNMTPSDVSELDINAGDSECLAFWEKEAEDYIIGKGKTPTEALMNLRFKLITNNR